MKRHIFCATSINAECSASTIIHFISVSRTNRSVEHDPLTKYFKNQCFWNKMWFIMKTFHSINNMNIPNGRLQIYTLNLKRRLLILWKWKKRLFTRTGSPRWLAPFMLTLSPMILFTCTCELIYDTGNGDGDYFFIL